jgi:hypothetical protein
MPIWQMHSLTDRASRQRPTAKVAGKMAVSDTMRVDAGQGVSFKKNIAGERNGAHPERSMGSASALMRSAGCGGAVTLSSCLEFGGLGRDHRSPSPPNGQIAEDARRQCGDSLLDCRGRHD